MGCGGWERFCRSWTIIYFLQDPFVERVLTISRFSFIHSFIHSFFHSFCHGPTYEIMVIGHSYHLAWAATHTTWHKHPLTPWHEHPALPLDTSIHPYQLARASNVTSCHEYLPYHLAQASIHITWHEHPPITLGTSIQYYHLGPLPPCTRIHIA